MPFRKIVLWILFLGNACLVTAQAKSVRLDRLEAAVNSNIVLASDIQQFKKTIGLRTELDPLFKDSEIEKMGVKAPNPKISEFIIDERLIADEFPAKDSEVEQQINTIQATNQISRDDLMKLLKDQGYQFEQYFEIIRASLSKRNLIDRDIRTKVHISDDDIKNYFYNHYEPAKKNNIKYHLSLITVTPANYKSPEAAREIGDRAAQALKTGEDFVDVAKRFSDHPTAQGGGDLGFLSADTIAPQIRSELMKLKVGETSNLLGNQKDGYFILRLLDLKSGQEDKLEVEKERIHQLLTAQEYRRQITLWLERQKQTAYIHRVAAE